MQKFELTESTLCLRSKACSENIQNIGYGEPWIDKYWIQLLTNQAFRSFFVIIVWNDNSANEWDSEMETGSKDCSCSYQFKVKIGHLGNSENTQEHRGYQCVAMVNFVAAITEHCTETIQRSNMFL